eukprot:CAMPEP_0176239198 /NCGR_PEP_ID=MMETSP0121_2-20121125/28750_1 /TAXON_ID=160619 /ORGANISM="Kryptoperidinium foliaceum, Strain CCMP 1326" /LENGTH=457 /DNA_ID=CAMNT_0017578683 /DNA_START=111 /DNA_END=1481 /DNA_ORIENTATION=+
MKLGQRQFERRCLEIGYRGNLTALWKYLDGDGSGTVGIMEFHNQAAQVLAGFKAIMMDSFDDSLPDMFAALDSKRRGRLTKIEFIAAMYKVGFKGPAARLFEYLDKRNVGTVSEQDVAYMQRWRPPPYVFSTPDTEGLSELRRKFLDIYRTSLRVWRRCFDRNGSMSMSWEEFVDAVGELVRRTKLPPYSEKALAAIWRALDADCSGSITLREWDEPSHRALSEFKQWADRVHGSVVKAFRALDSNSGNAKLSEGELNRAARGDDPCRADLELIFEGLDVHGTGAILESGVRFLDVWDLSWEEWLHHEMNAAASSSLRLQGQRGGKRVQDGAAVAAAFAQVSRAHAETSRWALFRARALKWRSRRPPAWVYVARHRAQRSAPPRVVAGCEWGPRGPLPRGRLRHADTRGERGSSAPSAGRARAYIWPSSWRPRGSCVSVHLVCATAPCADFSLAPLG